MNNAAEYIICMSYVLLRKQSSDSATPISVELPKPPEQECKN